MKLKTLAFLTLLLLSLMPLSFAVETVAFEKPASSADMPLVKDFHAVVTGNGELVLKPGPVFTDGRNFEGMELPYLVSTPKAIRYPRWALRQGWEGDLSIAIEIKEDGSVGRSKIMKSTGHKMLDEAAAKAVGSWKFHPAKRDGKIVVTCIQIPVSFKLSHKD